jgi:hypothetical protein
LFFLSALLIFPPVIAAGRAGTRICMTILADRAEQALDTQRDRVEGLLAKLATVEADAKAANDRAWASGEAVGALREQLAALEQRSEAGRARADRADSSATHEREDFLDA